MTPNPQDSAVALEVERVIREVLAAGPTPGEWTTAKSYGSGARCSIKAGLARIAVPSVTNINWEANAALIAACNPDAMRSLLAEIDRLRASQSDGTSGVPDGWKLVPVEPTVEMLSAGAECWHISKDNADGYYRAMLAAAPNQGENHVG